MTNKLTWVDVGKISLRNRENILYNHEGEKCSFKILATVVRIADYYELINFHILFKYKEN